MVVSSRATRPSLPAQLAVDLLRRIADGEWAPGEAIPAEAELAAEASVGRSTVREAVKELLSSGVLEIRRGRGTYVRSPDDWSPFSPLVLQAGAGGRPDTTQQVLEARRLVEAGVAELAAQRATLAHLTAVDDAIAAMEQASDVDAFVEADLAFHQALMDAAGNPFVAALFQPIGALLYDERRRTSERASLRPRAIAAHKRIADAVRRRDPAAARSAMVDHIEETASLMRRSAASGRRGRRRR